MERSDNMTFEIDSHAVKVAMCERAIGFNALMARAGICQSTLERVLYPERQKKGLQSTTVNKLATALGVRVTDLLKKEKNLPC